MVCDVIYEWLLICGMTQLRIKVLIPKTDISPLIRRFVQYLHMVSHVSVKLLFVM